MRAVFGAELCRRQRVCEIHAAKCVARTGFLDRRSERAKDLIDAEQLASRRELLEVDDLDAQLGPQRLIVERSTSERDDTRDAGIGEQQTQALAPDEARRAEQHHRTSPSG
jgi:hypothetical protein